MTDKPKRVIVIDGGHRGGKTLRILALMQAYGAGQVKQARVAGEYPPPDVLGTVTGRLSSAKPNVREQLPSREFKPVLDPRTKDLCNADYSEIEKRVLSHFDEPPRDLGRFDCRGNYKWPDAYARGPEKLSETKRTTVNTRDMLKQAAVSEELLKEWQATLRAAGYKPAGDGPLADTWIKENNNEEL